LLERLSLAIQAAGMNCWEFSYEELRFTWFDSLPPGVKGNAGDLVEVSRQLAQTILPEDEVAVREATTQALATGKDTLASVMRSRDIHGNIRYQQLYQRFFRDTQGRPLRALGATRDITAEIEASEKLRQQTELLQETQRRLDRATLSMQEGHWELDRLTRRHWASRSYLALLGYAEGELEIETLDKVQSIIHPDDVPGTLAATESHLAGGPAYDVEVRLRTRNGSYRWFRLRGCAERNAEGVAVRLSGSITDIQKQRVAEEALREAQARFARAIQGTQDGLWELDLQQGRMWLSPRVSELLGFAEGELSNTPGVLHERFHPEDGPVADAALSVALNEGLPIDLEARMRTRQGEYRWFRLKGTPGSSQDGGKHRISGSIQDVTEARAARDALIKASEVAQAANRAKSEFLANVSHEIRTPMNGIIGMARLLLDTSLDGTQRDYADTIRSSADSLLTVINDLLDFSKIEAGRLDIEHLELDLPATVEDICAVMAFQAAARHLDLIVNVHPDVPRYVLGDPQRIRQCLVNLLGNAIKFTLAGEIVCEVSMFGREPGRAHIRFEVRDTGIGIAPEKLGMLFEPFVQADSSTTRHFGGTGLGLSIVRRLVGMMGGKTAVASVPGKGSTFWFELPVSCAGGDSDSSGAYRAVGQKRVMIVDANGTTRGVLAGQLEHAGYDAEQACSGAEALDKLREAADMSKPVDAVLVSAQLPDMDGISLVRRLSSDPMLCAAHAVLLTAVNMPVDSARVRASGFVDHLPKPVRTRELLACLKRVLTHEADTSRREISPAVAQPAIRQGDGHRFRGRVLLVEDNVINQKVARRFLERMGCEVTVAENGQEALRAYRQNTYRMVLMDVQMPVMDGYQAAQGIRGLEAGGSRVPIVALTANAMAGQLERSLQAGMDALLTKPLDVAQLEQMLERFGLADGAPGTPASGVSQVSGGRQRAPERQERPERQETRETRELLETLELPALLNAPQTPGMVPAPGIPVPVAPVDLVRWSQLIGGDGEFAAALVRSYIDSAGTLLKQIRECVGRDDRTQLARAVHQLMGASGGACAVQLRDLCADFERSARDAGSDQLDQHVARIQNAFERAREVLLSLAVCASERTQAGMDS